MKIDLTIPISKDIWVEIFDNEKMTSFGHLGTHYDVKGKVFSLDNIILKGILFDVSNVINSDIGIEDIEIERIQKDQFVIFYTSYLKKVGYGTKEYFSSHPQLSEKLINHLIERQVKIIGIDAAGIRRGKQHPIMDQYCADHDVFVVENLYNLDILYKHTKKNQFIIYTFPLSMEELDGLPCRVVAEVLEKDKGDYNY